MPVEERLAGESQLLHDACKQVSKDAELEMLSSLILDADKDGIQEIDPLNAVMKSRSNVSAAAEIQRLVVIKQAVYNLLQDSEQYIKALEKALQATHQARKDLNAMEDCLRRANIAEQEDESEDVLPIHANKVRLPLYPSIYQQVPLLTAQLEEVEQLRHLVSTFPWASDEVAKLKKAVLNQCLRVFTLRLASSNSCPEDLLGFAAEMDKEELVKIPLSADHFSEEPIDWNDVAEQVGGTHTCEECRTRWLVIERPGLHQGVWTVDEKKRLASILQKHIKLDNDGIVRDWESISRQLDTGRLGIDCFMQSKQQGMVPAYASSSVQAWVSVPMSDKETEIVTRLRDVWNDEAMIAARLGTGRPRQQMTSITKKEMKRKPPVKKNFKWSASADKALIAFIAKECNLRRGLLFAHLDSIGHVDFSKQYRLRPSSVSTQAVEKRWNHIKQTHKESQQSKSI